MAKYYDTIEVNNEEAKLNAKTVLYNIGGIDAFSSIFPVQKASGEVASFTDGASGVNLKSLSVKLGIKQDLNGYDRPWAGGSGKNLAAPLAESETTVKGITYTFGANGRIIATGTSTADNADTPNKYFGGNTQRPITFKANTPYTMSLNGTFNVSNSEVRVRFLNAAGTSLWTGNNGEGKWTFTPTEDFVANRVAIRFARTGNTVDIDGYLQIEEGSTATAYEPYENKCPITPWESFKITRADSVSEPAQSEVYNISLESEDTIYGGTIDVISGQMAIDKASVIVDGSSDEGWYAMTTANVFRANAITPTPASGATDADVEANPFASDCTNVTRYNYNLMKAAYPSISFNTEGRLYLAISEDVTTIEQAIAWLAENQMQVVYTLAEPITVQLSPNEITTLLGVNHIWSDAGDVEVEYRTDLLTYIDKKIAEALNG